MKETLTIAKYRWREVQNDLARSPGQRVLAVFVIAFNLFGALFTYQGFVALLDRWASVGNDELFARGILLLLSILGIAYLLSLVSAAKEFLGRPQIPLLLVVPLKPSSLLWTKYLAVIADRNLEMAVIVLGVPCLAAMHKAGLTHALHLLPPFVVSVLLANMAAVGTVLLVARYARPRRMLALGFGMIWLISLLAWLAPAAALAPLQSLGTHWPTAFAAQPLLTSLTTTLAVLGALWILGRSLSRIYAPAWSRLQETRLVRKKMARRSRKHVSDLAHQLLSPWQGATRAILLKDWRTMGRSPLFPVRLLGLLVSWILFAVIKQHLKVQTAPVAIALVVAYVLICLQATIVEPTANAFAGEANRLALILTAPLRPAQIVRAKLIAQWAPALLACAISTFVIGALAPLSPSNAGSRFC